MAAAGRRRDFAPPSLNVWHSAPDVVQVSGQVQVDDSRQAGRMQADTKVAVLFPTAVVLIKLMPLSAESCHLEKRVGFCGGRPWRSTGQNFGHIHLQWGQRSVLLRANETTP